MLIPYDNEVIPIAKDLRRNFKDDEPGTGHNGTSSDPLSVHINDGVLRLKPGADF